MTDTTTDLQQPAQSMIAAGETAASAVAAQAMAATQARYVMAMKNPRDIEQVRSSILKECKRPGFAEVAKYHKPIGEGVVGPSIRFVEAALRCMTNVLVETPAIFDDAGRRIVRVMVTDLESNLTHQKDVTIVKTVERQRLKEGEVAISERLNSWNKTVYTRSATDDEILDKEGALISKAVRTLGLRLIPGDLVAESMEQVDATKANTDAKDPDAARRKLLDAFAVLGVTVAHLLGYLRHPIEKTTKEEWVKLQGVYTTIRDGEARWADFADQAGDGEPQASKSSRTAEALGKKRAAKGKDKAPKPEGEPACDPDTGVVDAESSEHLAKSQADAKAAMADEKPAQGTQGNQPGKTLF